MNVILASELAKFAPYASTVIADAVVRSSDEAFTKWNINTPARMQMFMAQAFVESAGFSKLFEDMDYTTIRIRQVWPSRFPTNASAEPYAHNPEKLANFVYGGRMGNMGSMDGYYCRGQGLLQLTGLSDFAKLAKAMNVSVDQCRAMLTAPDTMLDCAAATFVAWGLIPYADHQDVTGATRTLNGALNGLADRRTAFAKAKAIWPTIRALK